MSQTGIINPPPAATEIFQRPFPGISEGLHIQFPLSGGNLLEISLQRKISLGDFKKIKALLDLAMGSLVEEETAA